MWEGAAVLVPQGCGCHRSACQSSLAWRLRQPGGRHVAQWSQFRFAHAISLDLYV